MSDAARAARRLLRTRGALAAAITAAGLGAVLLVQTVVGAAITAFGVPPEVLGNYWPSLLGYGFVTTVVPLVVGFFLSLWLVGPIADALGVGHVIARSVLATGIGATLVVVIRGIANVVTAVTVDGGFFGNSFPEVVIEPGIPALLGEALSAGLLQFVSVLPLGVLAGLLLWLWRRANPAAFHIEGLVDV